MLNHPTDRRLRVGRLAILLATIALSVGSVALLNDVQVRRQAGALLDRADAAAAKEDWPAAVRLYQSYLNFRPRDAAAVARYADAMEGAAKTKPATRRQLVVVYERLLQLDDSLAEQRRRLARHYLDLRLVSACRHHVKALMAAPDFARSPDAELYAMAGACDAHEQKYAEAAEHYRKAIATGAAGTDAHLQLAVILHDRLGSEEDRAAADKVMNDLVAGDGASVERRLARARFRSHIGRSADALADARQAYERSDGRSADAALLYADLASAADDHATAEAVLAKAAETIVDSRVATTLATVQLRNGKPEEAAQTIETAAAAAATRGLSLTLAEYVERLIDLHKAAAAASHAERFAADPQFAPLGDYLVARVLLADGNWPAAAKKLHAAIQGGLADYRPQQLNAYLALAECYRLANNPDRRLQAAEEAVALTLPLRADYPALTDRAELARADALAGVGRRRDAMETYSPLVARSKEARVALCRLTLADLLDRPESERNFAVLDERLGPPPYSLELVLVRVGALIAQNRVADALALLEQAATQSPGAGGVWAALALAHGGRGATADALAALDRAERAVLDTADLRIARAQLLARSPDPDVSAIRSLADNVGTFDQPERHRLASTLGGLFTALGRRADAADLYRQAASEMPYDLTSRLALFDLAVARQDAEAQSKLIEELAKIEGEDGPTKLVAEASRDLLGLKPGETDRILAVRRRVEQARAQRESWGRVHALLGDLDLFDGRGDGALGHYRRAVELGERGDAVVRNLVRLLLDRGGHQEAFDTLARLGRSAALPPDLQTQFIVLRSAFGEDQKQNLAWARSPQAAASRSHQDHLLRAAVLTTSPDQRDRNAARAALETAVGLRPESADAWVALVRFLAANGLPKDAEAAAAQAAAKARPETEAPADRAALLVALGTLREVLGDAPAAEARYREAAQADPANIPAHDRLASLLYRTSRRPEADALLTAVARTAASADVKRWSRRTLALAIVAQPDGYVRRNDALKLIDENLADRDTVEDRRARALVLAVDPSRRDEAMKLLTAARNPPLTADQAALLARLQVQARRYDLAEVVLREATRATYLVPPDHLALLVRVQIARGNAVGARETAERLRAAAPNSWLATAEHCRVLAAEGKAADAVRLLNDMVPGAGHADLVGRIGPLLEELKAEADARRVYERSMAGNPSPAAHAPLAQFFVRTGKPEEAAKLGFEFAAAAPAGATARILAAAARSRPGQLTPTPTPEWGETLKRIDAWVADQHRTKPADLEVLFAKAELDDVFGRFDDALATYARGLELAPDHPVLLNNHAVLLALHRPTEWRTALAEIEKVIGLLGPVAAVLDSRAVIHSAGAQYAAANQDLQAAVAADPKPVYLFHMAQVYDRRSAEEPDLAPRRDDLIRQARAAGLAKVMLHPKEWGQYDELVGGR